MTEPDRKDLAMFSGKIDKAEFWPFVLTPRERDGVYRDDKLVVAWLRVKKLYHNLRWWFGCLMSEFKITWVEFLPSEEFKVPFTLRGVLGRYCHFTIKQHQAGCGYNLLLHLSADSDLGIFPSVKEAQAEARSYVRMYHKRSPLLLRALERFRRRILGLEDRSQRVPFFIEKWHKAEIPKGANVWLC